MYLKYFGLTEAPFSIAPDPRYLYMSKRHREALAHLLYGVKGGGGFVLLTGEVGAGKTTVCRCLLEQIPDSCDIAYIFNPKLTVEELLSTLCLEFGIDIPPGTTSIKVFIDCINRYLLDAHARGRHSVLIIDEAQNLTVDVLEQMRLLTNLETNTRKLLQIILLGQPELATMLEQPELRQLAQRIVARYHLGPLNKVEVAAYLRHRLDVSGVAAGTRQLFPGSLIAQIYRLTGGVPRLLNVLCDRALLGAFVQGKERVDRATLKRAASEVFPLSSARRHGRIKLLVAGGLLAVAALLVTPLLLPKDHPPAIPDAAKPATKPAAKPAAKLSASVQAIPAVLAWPAEEQRTESQQLAFGALFKAWGMEYQGPDSCQPAVRSGLNCHSAKGNLRDVRQLDRPVVMTMHGIDRKEPVFFATLFKLDKENATFAVGSKTTTVAITALIDQWSGLYTVLWRKPSEARAFIRNGERGPAVLWLSRQLAAYEGAAASSDPDPVFDAAMIRRLKHFQMSQDLEPDGAFGPKTLMRLASVGDRAAPRLSVTGGR
ncbi:MAG: AAA family ATPase [Sulfuritalea sp.]|jgi:general secretion pathway protein A|nr:AAA family ATPase [Sulfuritalea sp.]